ncbi:MAG: glycosyltransferase family 2 protein [Chloroflexi bacterium]|nr:glycosyltransferase family 2 protein [Chloroflexota bacterium]
MDTEIVDVSIIIVTYNGREITLRTLAAYRTAIAADTDHQYEVIVVDNASQDGVADAIEAGFPDVLLIRNPDNVGFSAANNLGFGASRGQRLLFSNPDIEVNPGTLPTLINLVDANPDVGACTPFLRLARTGEIDWGAHRGFPTPWAALTYFTRLAHLLRRSRSLSRIFGQYHLLDRDLTQPHDVDVIRGGFFFTRREAFVRAGQWDEDYFMFGEDIDLCYQMKRLGYRIMFYPQAEAIHYHGMTTGLKRHSQGLSPVDEAAQARVYNAFYDTMKLFYDKNYRDRYGGLVRWLVFRGVDLRRALGRRRGTV